MGVGIYGEFTKKKRERKSRFRGSSYGGVCLAASRHLGVPRIAKFTRYTVSPRRKVRESVNKRENYSLEDARQIESDLSHVPLYQINSDRCSDQ